MSAERGAGSVRTTAWIPVIIDGRAHALSLEDTLLTGHRVTSLAIRDDLERSAVLRFLTSIATLIARESHLGSAPHRIPSGVGQPQRTPISAAQEAAIHGFDRNAVTAVLDRLDDLLWLVHPEHPFMQDHRAEAAAPHPARTLHPAVPGSSTSAWFTFKGTLAPALNLAEAIRTLVTFYFHAGGNNGGLTMDVTETRKFKFAPRPGGPGTRGTRPGHTDTQLWWVGANLTATLLMNIAPNWVTGDSSLPAFFEKPGILRPPGSLAEWTHSGVTALLDVTAEAGELTVATAHVSGLILPELAADPIAFKKARTEQARRTQQADPHRVFRTVTRKDGTTYLEQVDGITPANTTVQNLAGWWAQNAAPVFAHGILSPSITTPANVAVLTIDAKISPGTISIEGTGWTTVDRELIGDGVSDTTLLYRLAQDVGSNIEQTVAHACYLAFRDADEDTRRDTPLIRAVNRSTLDLFYGTARELLEGIVEASYRGKAPSDDLRTAWWRAVLDAFDAVTGPLLTVSAAPRIAMARNELLQRTYAAREEAA